MSRHRSSLVATLLLVLFQIAAAPKPDDEIPPRLDAAVSNALGFLARQQAADGSFENNGPKVATTSLCLLSFLSTGHVPDLGKYGLTVRSAVDWLTTQQAPDGYFGAGEHGMYTHAIATLALAQEYGVETNAARRIKLHTSLEKAVGVILAAQSTPKSSAVFVGGWRYERNSPDSDLSLSGWNVLALRAARDAGITVPAEARQRALAFVLHCWDDGAKAFAYQPGSGAQPGDTAIAILCLHLLDGTDAHPAKLSGAVKYLQAHPVEENASYVYYATYYVVQASYQQGQDLYGRLGRSSFERLIRTQEKDGGWPVGKSGQEPGRVYATAMAVQTLAVPFRLLPVYQR